MNDHINLSLSFIPWKVADKLIGYKLLYWSNAWIENIFSVQYYWLLSEFENWILLLTTAILVYTSYLWSCNNIGAALASKEHKRIYVCEEV